MCLTGEPLVAHFVNQRLLGLAKNEKNCLRSADLLNVNSNFICLHSGDSNSQLPILTFYVCSYKYMTPTYLTISGTSRLSLGCVRPLDCNKTSFKCLLWHHSTFIYGIVPSKKNLNVKCGKAINISCFLSDDSAVRFFHNNMIFR